MCEKNECINEKAQKIYNELKETRQKIINRECPRCFHNYIYCYFDTDKLEFLFTDRTTDAAGIYFDGLPSVETIRQLLEKYPNICF